jgi:hypothetical protein
VVAADAGEARERAERLGDVADEVTVERLD